MKDWLKTGWIKYKDWLKTGWIKYIVLVIVFGVWFFTLPGDEPGDIAMLCAVPFLFSVSFFILIFIDLIVWEIQWRRWRREAYNLEIGVNSTSDEEA